MTWTDIRDPFHLSDEPAGAGAAEPPLEAERYELQTEPVYRFDLSRRDFCRALGGGLLVLMVLSGPAGAQPPRQSGRAGRRSRTGGFPSDLAAWIRITPEGKVEASTGKVEVGQGIRTSLAQAVADELRLRPEEITLIMGDTQNTPFDRGTFGSRTTPDMAPQMRRAAAAAREGLIDLAAETWKVSREQIEVRDGMVSHPPSGRSAAFGALARGRALTRQISAEEPVTPPEKWSAAGASVPNVNGRAIVTGAHQYPSDLRRPGMLYGRVLRPASFEAELVSVDLSEARKMPGVVAVRDGNFVGVAAPTPEEAARALEAIRAEWTTPRHPSEAELFDYFKANPSNQSGWGGSSRESEGDLERGLGAADRKLEARYTVAYIAHAPLEPRAALAEWNGGKLTVSVGTQRPFGVRSELAQAFSIPEESVRVLMPDTGSGYGGKHTGEVAVEAARLARAAKKPVKVVWTREEEFTWAYFRPAGLIEVRSGIGSDGRLTAWEFHNWNSGGSGLDTPYDVAHKRVQFHAVRSPLRQGSYRALASTANHFARESHMDELAHAAGVDPLEFRLRNLSRERLRAVLEAAAGAFGWKERKKEKGRGFGLACGTEKGGYVANCVEVETADGDPAALRVVRAVTAFECGAIVNPDGLKNQVEGCVIQGLGGALREAIHFGDGRILNASFKQYRVPRFSDLPKLETVLLDRKDLPSAGAGEAPIVTIAPAVANALFDATGRRVRSLPLLGGLKG